MEVSSVFLFILLRFYFCKGAINPKIHCSLVHQFHSYPIQSTIPPLLSFHHCLGHSHLIRIRFHLLSLHYYCCFYFDSSSYCSTSSFASSSWLLLKQLAIPRLLVLTSGTTSSQALLLRPISHGA